MEPLAIPRSQRITFYPHLPLESCNIVGGAIVRLIGAVLMEANDEWSLQHRYLSLEPLNDLASAGDEEPSLLAPPAEPAHLTPAAA